MLLVLAAFVCAIASAAGRLPVWVATLLISIVLLLERLPK